MQLVSMRKSTDYLADFNMTTEETNTLVEYAKNNIPKEALENYLLEWAVVDCLKKYIDENTPPKTKTKVKPKTTKKKAKK